LGEIMNHRLIDPNASGFISRTFTTVPFISDSPFRMFSPEGSNRYHLTEIFQIRQGKTHILPVILCVYFALFQVL
jgi:hypothetical protein